MVKENKIIKNLVDQINKDYHFIDQDGTDLRLFCNPNLNGYELWLSRKDNGAVVVIFTQYQQVKRDTTILILKMLYHDILNRQALGHYSVKKRV